MNVGFVDDMHRMDREAMDGYGIPETVLMENAGRAAASLVSAIAPQGKRVCVLAGSGNNGGDALAAVRHLVNGGYTVTVFLLGNPQHRTESCLTMLRPLRRMSVTLHEWSDENGETELRAALRDSDAVLDGILGTGFHGTLRPAIDRVIRMVNASKKPVIAIDIPSGVNADTGEVKGTAVRASATAVLALPQPGHFLSPGADYAGKQVIDTIGMPHPLLENPEIRASILDETCIASLLPVRPRAAHKGVCGRILIVAGSRGMTGAAALSSSAVLRGGAGIATLAVPKSLNAILEEKVTEVMTIPVEDEGKGYFPADAAVDVSNLAAGYDGVLLGPGLGRTEETCCFVRRLVSKLDMPLLLDADALYAFTDHTDELRAYSAPLVLTPHLGELARLLGTKIPDLRQNLPSAVRKAARDLNAILVAKSECTIVAYPDGHLYFSVHGNSGMATGGSGDVLAGTIAAFVKQADPETAPLVGTYLHGFAGDLAAEQFGEGLIASDILHAIPKALMHFRQRQNKRNSTTVLDNITLED